MSTSGQARAVVIFCGKHESPSTTEHIEAIADAFPHWSLTVVQEFPPRRWRSDLRDKARLWAKDPFSYPVHLLGSLLTKASRHRRAPAPGPGGPRPLPQSLSEISRPNVRYERVRRLHARETRRQVAGLGAWLGVSIGAPILKKSLYDIPELGTVNLHKSLLPHYRGLPPGFWELHDEAGVSGVTVHWVDAGLDTGPIITQRPLPIPPYSTPRGLAVQLDVLGTEVLLEGLQKIDRGETSFAPQPPSSAPTYRQPPYSLVRKVRRRCRLKRRGPRGAGGVLVDAAKGLVLLLYAWLYCGTRNAARALRGGCHTRVLLYHRVSDEFLDPLTVGIEQFEDQLRFLKRHYEIIDLQTFLESRGRPRHRPSVVLTFDDGYQDNYLAALLLRRIGLPCTFFVSTRIVGTENAFPHDLERLGHRVPALRWDQVRRMASWGFRIGNHTAYHTRLSSVPADQAVEEIAEAAADLRRELNDSEPALWLAYPYGKPEDITDEVRQRLAGWGVTHILSASGGTNPPDFDPLNVLRQGVDFRFTHLRLRATLEGWLWRT